MLLTASHIALDSATSKALLMLLIPFIVFWVLILFGRIIKKYRGVLATSLMFLSTIIATILFITTWGDDLHSSRFSWIDVGEYHFHFGLRVDALSSLFALIVCFISFLVHLFSIEYLRGDKHFEKYFAYLGLFTFSMIGIIFSENLLQLFLFWELVGFSSYLLIGFWFNKEKAVAANKKAFLVNRVGDVGFLLGILILFGLSNTLSFDELTVFISNVKISDSVDWSYFVKNNVISKGWLTVGALGIASGGLAKSAQFPFTIWLPNAMEGPTPVSALIHAATMVAAGIYLLARFTFIMPDLALDVLAIIGVFTAFIAAVTAITQTDIKKVLAFSTISQLGYMVMAIGVQSYQSALFHLLTHAFFKAALFLCAGAIIHSLHKMDTAYGIKKLYPDFDEQNMKQMGGLRKKIPLIFWVYTIALAGIIGVPLFSGFLSKDAILIASLNWASAKSGLFYLIPLVSLITVALTAFYMVRQYLLVFFGENRLAKQLENAPEKMSMFVTKERLNAPFLMKLPPIVLAILTLGPVFALNPFDGESSWLLDRFPRINYLEQFVIPHTTSHTLVSILSLVLMLIGVALAYFMFEKGKMTKFRDRLNNSGFFHGLSYHHWYLDKIYNTVLIKPTLKISKINDKIDKYLFDGVVNSTAALTKGIGNQVAKADVKIIDRIIQVFGILNVIFAHISSWVDKNLVDGLVNAIAWIGIKIGRIAKLVHSGKVQNHMIWSFIFIGIIVILLAVFI